MKRQIFIILFASFFMALAAAFLAIVLLGSINMNTDPGALDPGTVIEETLPEE